MRTIATLLLALFFGLIACETAKDTVTNTGVGGAGGLSSFVGGAGGSK